MPPEGNVKAPFASNTRSLAPLNNLLLVVVEYNVPIKNPLTSVVSVTVPVVMFSLLSVSVFSALTTVISLASADNTPLNEAALKSQSPTENTSPLAET